MPGIRSRYSRHRAKGDCNHILLRQVLPRARYEDYRRALCLLDPYGLTGFKFVPDPMPMRNSKGAVVYYLFFASHNEAGDRIARSIFRKYRNRGVP